MRCVASPSGDGEAGDIVARRSSIHGKNEVVVGCDRHPCGRRERAAAAQREHRFCPQPPAAEAPGRQVAASVGSDQHGTASRGGGNLGVVCRHEGGGGKGSKGAITHDVKAVDAVCGGQVEGAPGDGGDSGTSSAGREKCYGREKNEKARKKKERPAMPVILLWGLRVERPVPVVLRNQRKGSHFRVRWVWKEKSYSPTAFYRKWEMGSNSSLSSPFEAGNRFKKRFCPWLPRMILDSNQKRNPS